MRNIPAGLSLGEYAAITYSEILSLEDAIYVVYKREEYMKKYVEPGKYKMAAVIGLETEKVKEICNECSKTLGFIKPVNYNSPAQIVVSGDENVIEKAAVMFKEKGALKVIILNAKSAFHTEKLFQAKEKLYETLKDIEINIPRYKVFKNIDGEEYLETDDVRSILANHIISPVYFEKCIKNMINDGVDTFIEIGPGKVLSGFVNKIDENVKIINISKTEDIKKLEEITC